MAKFVASEIYQFAIRIEEMGQKFYLDAAQKLKDNIARDVFKYLADQEVEHKKIFEGMLSKVEDYHPPESYPEEYFAYIKSYADSIIFSWKKLAEEVTDVVDVPPALDFGIRRELDSILYYLEIKKLLPSDQQSQIDRIIEEERRHYMKLNELKKNYS